ncbi:MAG: hypothetical protein HKN16_12010, partial [Saprospiraceae bacterium]|nr:hypothetical protein [Saprospiraceae bacterium]
MKSLYALAFSLISLTAFGQSDLVLTAVFDGPLPGGLPKGVEIYATADIADLSIYGLGVANNGGGSDGLEYNFPTGAITSGTYIYVTPDDAAFNTFYGFSADYIDGIANINGDDAVELYKDGSVVDVFGDVLLDGTGSAWEYLDGWAARVPGSGPDGLTFTLSNWTFSGINALDGESSNATAANPVPIATYDMAVTPDHTVTIAGLTFQPADLTIEQGETVLWVNETGVGHNVNGSQTTYPANPEGFTSGAVANNWEFTHTFNIAGQYNYQCNPHVGSGMTGTITVNEPMGPVYTAYDIATISTVDASGLPDSINVTAEITGIVHGIDFVGSASSASFYVIDATGGINVFADSSVPYTVTEGDQVKVQGTVSQNNGQTQIVAVNLEVLSSGNPLNTPALITTLDESTEGEFIQINDLTLVTPADWLGTGSSFTAMATDGTNMFAIRVDSDSEVANRPAPLTAFNIIGIGSQFDTSSPYDEGYQIFPRFNTDIIEQGGSVPVANQDQFTLEINGSANESVLGNDFLPGAVTSFMILDNPVNGMAVIEADSTITYNPFQDVCGLDSFTYEVCVDMLCDTGQVLVNVICPPEYPPYSIATVSTIDIDGIPDSIGQKCEVVGIVYGENLRPSGLQFTIIDPADPNAGIGVFNNTGDLGYTLQEGDEITVQGEVGFFFGLTQINAEAIQLNSSGNMLHAPEIVTALDEGTESKLILIEGLSIVDPADWDPSGSGFNVTVTDGSFEYDMRVDADIDLFNEPVPTMNFNLTGIGGQFDNTAPHSEGYQILPRNLSDLDFIDGTEEILEDPDLKVYPNPVKDILLVETGLDWDRYELFNVLGSQVQQGNFLGNKMEIYLQSKQS